MKKEQEKDEAALKAARREAEKAKLDAEVAAATAKRMEAEAAERRRREEALPQGRGGGRQHRAMMNRKNGVLHRQEGQAR